MVVTKTDEIHEEELKVEEGNGTGPFESFCSTPAIICLIHKLMAEVIGTYFLIFAGCGSAVVNKLYGETITFPGICVTWGLIVMVMIYSVAHISGAHFNPAVTLTFAIFGHFPYKEVPFYIVAQMMGSILASISLALMFDVTPKAFFGTIPVGSNCQSLAMEIIISFLLMFVIYGVATDTRAVGDLAGVAIGMTIMLNVFIAGPISGGSMNPARSLGPALVKHNFKGIWVYIIGPPIGTIAGAFAYSFIRFPDKPMKKLTKGSSFLKNYFNQINE